MENLSQLFAREVLGERQGRSISQIMADNLGINKNTVHLLMLFGIAVYLDSRKN